jgi:glycosyltransferase involved in cell wall biosynthesis
MKVLQVPFCYFPDKLGGTEIYVQALCRDLVKIGVNCVIVAPGDQSQAYEFDFVKVRRFAVSSQINDLSEMYGAGDELAANEFEKILIDEAPDLVHLHAHTRAISLNLVNKVKARNIPIVFTYHTPTVTCQRGTMLRWGETECDGFMEPIRCSECSLHGLGLNKRLSQVLARTPYRLARLFGKYGLKGGIWTAIRSRELVALRQKTVKIFFDSVDHIVAVCLWVQQVLITNGVSAEKITLCRQELTQEINQPEMSVSMDPPSQEYKDDEVLKLVFLGRLDPTKGVDIVIQAMALIPDLKIVLDIYGVSQGEAGAVYESSLRKMAKSDSRITFKPSVPSSEVIETLKQYSALVVPSRWMETGPLVVLEAFAAGIPVIGSNLGGIRELVHQGQGFVFETENKFELVEIIKKFASVRPLLKKSLLPPKTLAKNMFNIYSKQIVQNG